MALLNRLRRIVFTISMSVFTSIFSGGAKRMFMFFTCDMDEKTASPSSISSTRSVVWKTVFCLPVWHLVHFSRLSSNEKVSSAVLLAIDSNSYMSRPMDSFVRLSINMLNIILIDPMGERRSCAMTEYRRSRFMMVLRSSSFCLSMARLAATSDIWWFTLMRSSSLLNGLEI